MEAILDAPEMPDIFAKISEWFDSFKGIIERIEIERTQRLQRKERVDNLLKSLVPLVEHLPELEKLTAFETRNPEIRQMQLGLDFMARGFVAFLTRIKLKSAGPKKLPGSLFKKLKTYINKFRSTAEAMDRELMKNSDPTEKKQLLLHYLGATYLVTPLRVFIEDDDTGKFVSCFEFPQVYGYGETEEEALAMLDREILSLHKDIAESDSISSEYLVAKEIMDMALGY